jgi:hypothetical protein
MTEIIIGSIPFLRSGPNNAFSTFKKSTLVWSGLPYDQSLLVQYGQKSIYRKFTKIRRNSSIVGVHVYLRNITWWYSFLTRRTQVRLLKTLCKKRFIGQGRYKSPTDFSRDRVKKSGLSDFVSIIDTVDGQMLSWLLAVPEYDITWGEWKEKILSILSNCLNDLLYPKRLKKLKKTLRKAYFEGVSKITAYDLESYWF